MTTSLPHLSHPKYRPDIDGLRAVAVLSVVAFHAFPTWMKGGFIGVDVFFVISGFLISTIIYENLDKGTFSFAEFYARRIRRIFPALLLVLFASYAFGWFNLMTDEYKQLGKHIAAGAGFVSNFVLWSEAGYFDNSAETKPLLHLWSLGVEEQFYIVWPLVLWFAWKRKFNLLTLTVIVAVTSFALNIKGVWQDSVATFYSPQTRLWELMSGSILAWFALYKQNTYTNIKLKLDNWPTKAFYREDVEIDGTTLSNVFSFLGFLLLAYGFWRISTTVSFPGWWAVVPVSGTVLVILAGSNAWINRKILSNKIVVWLGLISFPLYLWHWPLLSFARIVEGEVPGRNIRIAAVSLSVVLAWLTYKLVERPIRSGKHENPKVIVLVVLMAIVGYVGFNTYSHDGLKYRSAVNNMAQYREDLRKEEVRLRQIEIRAGVCHFNKTGKYSDIDAFVSNWGCFSDDEALLNTRALVFGDSHAADKAMGLRLNGVDVVQLGGAGCSINPSLATDQRSDCRHLFDLVKRFENKYEVIVLSNSFPMSEINEQNLTQIFTYWSGHKEVYLFTPMPDFTAQINEFTTSGKIISAPDFSGENAFLGLVDKIGPPSSFTIIKTSDMWCLNRTLDESYPCSYVQNDELLMTDAGHLSVSGSKIFGRNMINHSALKSLLSSQ
jgi:peptidoglycan/LPS O-acetylase OafA/YrhL